MVNHKKNPMIDLISKIISEVLCLNHGYCTDQLMSHQQLLFSRYYVDIGPLSRYYVDMGLLSRYCVDMGFAGS